MRLLFGTLLVAIRSALGQTKEVPESVPISPTEAVKFTHSDRLTYDLAPYPESGGQPSLRFQVLNSDGICSQIFRIFLEHDRELEKPADAVRLLRTATAAYLSGSVEKKAFVQPIKRESGFAYYCILTNEKLASVSGRKEGEYRFVMFGIVKVSGIAMTVLGYSNAKDGDDWDSMMDVLKRIDVEHKAWSMPTTDGPQ